MKRKKPAKHKKIKLPFFLTREVIIVASLLLVALIFRLIYLSHLKANDPGFYNPSPGTDMLTYDNYAKEIINGTFSEKSPYYYGPLYFYFLALIYKIFGIDPYIPRLIQMILGVFTTFLTYLIAKKVFNKTVGYISLIISILYGMFYIHEGVLLMESLVTFLNTLSIFLLLRIEDNPSYKNLALAGIALGLSALTRANILLFVPFILIWMLKNSKLKTKNLKLLSYGFLCLIILFTISPATIRNYLVSGRFVLISTNGPVNLWIGNNPHSEGWFAYPPPEYSEKIAKMVKEKGDKAYIEDVVRFIKKNPKQYLKLLSKKFSLFWDTATVEIENNIDPKFLKKISWISNIAFLNFGFVASLGLLGILFSIRIWKKCLLLYLFCLSFMIGTILFFVLERYRIAFLPSLIPFAGFTLYWWYKKIKAKSYQTISLSLIPLILFLSLTRLQAIYSVLAPYISPFGFHIQREDTIVIRDNSGMIRGENYYSIQSLSDIIKKELIIREDIDNFKEVLLFFWYHLYTYSQEPILIFEVNGKEKKVIIKPTSSLVTFNTIYINPKNLKQGINTIIIKPKIKSDFILKIKIDSIYSFRRSYFLENGEWRSLKKGEYMIGFFLNPERSAKGHIAQGIEYLKNKMYDEAIFEFKEALKRSSDYPNLHYNLGLTYEMKKELDKAILEYKKEIEISKKINSEPEDIINMHNSLARIYYKKGMVEETIEECKNILALDPKNTQAYNNLINLKKPGTYP
ncbi:MAG: glycosyltransferase family 39 protein [bacterium]